MGSSQTILRTFRVNAFSAQLASDNHWPLFKDKPFNTPEEAADDLAEKIIAERQEKILFLLGDHFEASEEGGTLIETTQAINLLLLRVSQCFDKVFYIPGNHDLRRRTTTRDPWAEFQLPDNVVMPKKSEPLIEEIEGTRILVGNVFYDLATFDPGLLGLSREALLDFYSGTDDGKYLFDGPRAIGLFREMTRAMANHITPDVHIVATHTLPHPSLVKVKYAQMPDQAIQSKFQQQGIDVVGVREEDLIMANEKGIPLEGFLWAWNQKTPFMFSDLFNPGFGANPRDGLTVLYGHNHRGSESIFNMNEKLIKFLTYQRHYSQVSL